MRNIKLAIYFIGLGASLVIYAHANFSTKDMIKDIRENRNREVDKIDHRLDRMESKLDILLQKIK